MYTEHLAIMLLMAATQTPTPHAQPVVQQAPLQQVIRAMKEPELVAALNQRAARQSVRLMARKSPAISAQTMLASAGN